MVGCCQDVSSSGGCSSPCRDLAAAAVQRLSLVTAGMEMGLGPGGDAADCWCLAELWARKTGAPPHSAEVGRRGDGAVA